MVARALLLALAGCAADAVDTGGPVEPGDLEPATLTESGVAQCLDPAARETLGPYERFAALHQQLTVEWTWGNGVVAADLDGDERVDVVAPTEQGLVLFVGTDSGNVAEQTTQRTFAPFSTTFSSGASAADYDGDGDLDLYVTRITGYPAPPQADGKNLLLRNEGAGVFTDVTDVAGVSACGPYHRPPHEWSCYRSTTSAWADYDVDGDLDLYVGNYGYADDSQGVPQEQFVPAEPDFLYRNEGDGTFTDLSATLPIEVHDGYTYAGGFHDLDGDLDLDLYVVNDFGAKYPNQVMWNEGGELVWHPDEASGLRFSTTGMGLAAGDLNDDGALDLFIPAWNTNHYLESRRDLGVWVEATGTRTVLPDLARGQDVGWGGEFGDLDLDGDLDLVAQYGHLASDKILWTNALAQPDGVYLNEPVGSEWVFVDRAAELGMDDVGAERGGILVDVDRDGYLDLLKRSLHGEDSLYLSRCGEGRWLVVELEQPGTMNRHGVGARVEVEAGGRRWLRHVLAGGTSYASAGPPEVHFGLADFDRVDRIRVTWPDGAASEVLDVETRQRVAITRGEG